MGRRDRYATTETLVEALLSQKIVRGDNSVAAELATSGEVLEFASGQTLIEQGALDRDVYFILSGRVQLIINGMRVYYREAGQSVGEMSAINPQIARSATVEAVGDVVCLKVPFERLEQAGRNAPNLWRLLAIDLSSRVEQRNKLINRTNQRPVVFIICSAESLPVARAFRVGLANIADVDIWSDEQIFAAGTYPLEALESRVAESDFGIALAEPDDLVRSRDKQLKAPRDNVIFELGFFMSRLGRSRTLLLVPSSGEIKLPSDFKGLTPIGYANDRTDIPRAIGPALDQIIGIVAKAGVRSSLVEAR